MQLLWEGRTELEKYSTARSSREDGLRILDPSIPAVMQTAGAWHEVTGKSILIVHDRQAALTDEVCATLILAGKWPDPEFPIAVPIEDIVWPTRVKILVYK